MDCRCLIWARNCSLGNERSWSRYLLSWEESRKKYKEKNLWILILGKSSILQFRDSKKEKKKGTLQVCLSLFLFKGISWGTLMQFMSLLKMSYGFCNIIRILFYFRKSSTLWASRILFTCIQGAFPGKFHTRFRYMLIINGVFNIILGNSGKVYIKYA